MLQRIVRVGGLLIAALLVVACGSGRVHMTARPPNFIFILVDDLGYTDLAGYGSRYYETPNIDALARDGLRMTDGYAAGPNCSPTRAALMSGQYGARTGVYTVAGLGGRRDWHDYPIRPAKNVARLPLGKITIAQALARAGYATAIFGKWNLGDDGDFHPGQRGFDEAVVSEGEHFCFVTQPPVAHAPDAYLADFLTDQAVDFIRRHRDQRFFLLPHFAVHGPYAAKPELVAHFRGKPAAGGHFNPTYAAMIASVDQSVGRIVAVLDELGLADDTLVIFSSDNGGAGGYERQPNGRAAGITDNAPLRGGKGTLYEGGIRVPYIFRWPGEIPAGTTSGTPITSVDLFPTLLALAGAQPPPDYPLDGVSYAGLLTSGGKQGLDREAIYWHFPGYLGWLGTTWRTTPTGAIRAGDWKLLESFVDGHVELYNLRDDVGETSNLAAAQPERARELRNKLVAWRNELAAPMPIARGEQSTGGG
jgi:arylsulfatase A-like enzyme